MVCKVVKLRRSISVPRFSRYTSLLFAAGLPGEPVKEVETDSDICSDAGTAMVEVEGPSDV